MKHTITVFSGMSGAGKTALLLALNGKTFHDKSVKVMNSFCTRELRDENEPFRRHISQEEFVYMEKNGLFAQSIVFGAHSYGILASDIEAAIEQENILVDCVAQGIRQLQTRFSVKAAFLYARPQVLLQRLGARNKPNEIRFRLEQSAIGLKEALDCGLYTLFLDTGICELAHTVQKAGAFLTGIPVESDSVNIESYCQELEAVLSTLDKGGGASNV